MPTNTFGQPISQAGGSIVPTSYSAGAITSANTSPQSNIQLPTPPTDSNNYSGIVASGNAILKTLSDMQASQAPAPATQPTDLSALLQSYLGSSAPPPSASDTYKSLYDSSGVQSFQDANNTNAATLKTSQSKLDAINAQLAGVNAEATAIPIQDQKNVEGRGVTAAGLAPITSGELRNNALKAIPLQAQAIAAQAEVASAQGNAQLSQNLLTQAQDHLDRVFQIQMTDATNNYNYQKDLRDKVYQFATAQEQRTLDSQQKTADQAFTQLQDAIKNQQDLAKTAIQNGQSDVAAKIAALDPKSQNYKTDLATLQGQIKDTSSQLDAQLKKAQIAQIYSNINATNNNGGTLAQSNTRVTDSGIAYVDGTNLTGKDATQAQLFAAQNNIAYFDKTTADLQNNIETARQNMTNIQASLKGNLATSGLDVGTKLQNLLQSSTQIGNKADTLASFNAYRSAAIQALRAMAGAKGLRINQAEILQSVNQDIPKITDTVGVAQGKIDKVNSMLNSQEKGIFGSKYYKPSGQVQNSSNTADTINPLGI